MGNQHEENPLMNSSFTCQSEDHLPLPVLLSHRCSQVTRVHAAVAARQVGQEEVVGFPLKVHRHVQASVPACCAVRKVSGDKALGTRCWGSPELQKHQLICQMAADQNKNLTQLTAGATNGH